MGSERLEVVEVRDVSRGIEMLCAKLRFRIEKRIGKAGDGGCL